jgi:hypothetical protein
MSKAAISLTGLDAQNPLGFLAALGLLRVLDEHAVGRKIVRPALSFTEDGSVVPLLSTTLTLQEIVGAVMEDAKAQQANPILNLAYDDEGQLVPSGDARANRDLKPPPQLAAAVLATWAEAGRRVADLASSLFSELVQDNNANTKPTAFHFTAGQQAFLQMVDDLRQGLSTESLKEALIGPWLNVSRLPSLGWDSSVTRLYALRASDPAAEKRGSVPAANWLGFQALAFFPVIVRRRRLVTACVTGGWKNSVFRWPTWTGELTVPVIASILRLNVAALNGVERSAAGIRTVFSSQILRSDQGGYGSFSPADIVLPREHRRRS